MKDLATAPDNGQFFVLPELRIMYVSVAKNACTTLKWMMADIAGEDLSGANAGLLSFTDRAHIVHDRSKWNRSPAPAKISPEVLDGIDPDDGWFVFSAIRDPRSRCFSAWQDKLLMRNPAYTKWRDKPWFPRFPADPEAITADFADFAASLASDPKHVLLAKDIHFQPQTQLLRRDLVDYTRIYDISELGRLRDDVAAHLKEVGWQGEVSLRASNDTPLRANSRVFDGGVRELVEQVYADDFAAFGDRWDFSRVQAAGEWTSAAIDATAQRAATNERLGEMRDIAIVRGREIKELRTKVWDLRAKVKKLQADARAVEAARRRSPVRRATRLARRLLRRVPGRRNSGTRIRWS